jgi:molecular chaperone DnaK (HSP70)
MNTTKNSIVAAAIVATLGLGAIGVHSTLAAQSGEKGFTRIGFAAPMEGIVDAIATKFNLNKDEVHEVFDAHHKTMEAEMRGNHEQREADMLKKAVEKGELTQEQAEKIVAKHAEMKTTFEINEDKNPEEMKAEFEARREELKKWAAENGIPEKFIAPKIQIKHFRHGGSFGGEVQKSSN